MHVHYSFHVVSFYPLSDCSNLTHTLRLLHLDTLSDCSNSTHAFRLLQLHLFLLTAHAHYSFHVVSLYPLSNCSNLTHTLRLLQLDTLSDCTHAFRLLTHSPTAPTSQALSDCSNFTHARQLHMLLGFIITKWMWIWMEVVHHSARELHCLLTRQTWGRLTLVIIDVIYGCVYLVTT